ncbi:MAG: arginine--tRNA ligase [Akkermansia sp.]|nr:arginine--tRNA ligase [Akkermansia sp.]MDO5464231.1 arginine--tRNA ligase [Akkermansia sp.]
MTIPTQLSEKLLAALQSVLGENLPQGFVPAVTPSQDLRFGDYQSNAAMVLAKQVRSNPRALATQVVEAFGDSEMATLEIAGPGFINFRVRPEFFAGKAAAMLTDERLGVAVTEQPKTLVIDFSAPNVAKPMHVGHIRSTIIGDTLARISRFMGHTVITDNHIGDWGTQFGMILWGWKNLLDQAELEKDPIEALLNVYKTVNTKCKEDETLLPVCKAELVKLQSGDAENLAIWKRCIEVTKTGLEKIYAQLNISFDYWLGESAYNDALAPLVEDLIAKGIARESEGAICVFSDGFHKPEKDPFLVQKNGEWLAVPAIIRKADGGFLYATTDLATLDYRTQNFNADSIWYVVGAPQDKHFKQIFDIERMRGVTGDFRHVAFGSILGKDRRPFKTRSGDTVSLQDVIDEAVARATKVVEEKSPDMPEDEKARVAQIVGVGAIKFAELSQNRMSDYIFDWDKMLSLSGDTAPYLQNSYVRVRSIFRKIEGEFVAPAELNLSEDAEIHLARMLVRFAEVVPSTLDDCRPNLLAAYLYDLARAFHSFYEACPVLKSEGAVRESRLALCELTARVLKQGMGLFGIEMPERM